MLIRKPWDCPHACPRRLCRICSDNDAEAARQCLAAIERAVRYVPPYRAAEAVREVRRILVGGER